MRLIIAAVGRLRSGPEAALTEDYLDRASKAGRPLALGPAQLIEVEAGVSGDAPREAELLLKSCPPGAKRILLDERGENWPSRRLADALERWRDSGAPACCFYISGPNGAAPTLAHAADATIAFGVQTWPHRLVRAMLAEQLYRAVSILAGSPYHRD